MDDERFRDALAQCQGSHWWDLPAAAAGAGGALERVEAGITRAELDRSTLGRAIAPSVVAERVEALAAFSPSRLAEVVASWRPAAEAPDDDPFWSAAWRAASRHLATGPQEAHSGDEPAGRSWDELAGECRARYTPFDRICAWADSPLADTSIGGAQLEAPLLMLRVLRGREHLLDGEARARLLATADQILKIDPFEAALVLETVSVFDGEAIGKARDDVISELPSVTDPRALIPLVYVLTGRGWTVP